MNSKNNYFDNMRNRETSDEKTNVNFDSLIKSSDSKNEKELNKFHFLFFPMEFHDPETKEIIPDEIAYKTELQNWGYEFQEYNLSNNQIAENENKTDTICVDPQIFKPSNNATKELPSIHTVQPENNSGKIDGNKITPYTTLEKILKIRHFRVLNDCLYMHDISGYIYNNCTEAKINIMRLCREDVACVGTAQHAQRVYDLLLIEPRIQIKTPDNRSFISFKNGALELTTLRLLNQSPDIFATFRLNTVFTKNTYCPNFEQLLIRISGGDKALIDRIWEMFGYCLTPDTSAKTIFVLQGISNSGKSLLCDILSLFFYDDNVTSLSIHDLDKNFTLSELIGKQLCFSPDLPSGVLNSKTVSVLKQLSGNDLISADIKYENRKRFRCQATFVCATNHPLFLSHTDQAFFDRLVVIPFRYSIPKNEIDPLYIDRVKNELPGIAYKSLLHYRILQQKKYIFSGDYKINDNDTIEGYNNPESIDERIQTFLLEYFECDHQSYTFIDDIHDMFQKIYHPIHINPFSEKFTALAENLYGLTTARKRKTPQSDAKKCIMGLKFKSNV